MKKYYSTLLIASLYTCIVAHKPTVSIITSLYDGDAFIAGFMEDIVNQTIFDECELIIINANSPGHEDTIIQPYVATYPNIIYKKFSHDPGIYGVWNIAIRIARGHYITNANVDDRLRHDCYELHKNCLDNAPDIDLIYSDCYITNIPNETFEQNNTCQVLTRSPFSLEALKKCCLPNNHPMWRKSLHVKYGLFDESFKIAGDWEMWLRAATCGAQFAKLDMVLGLYFLNPRGLSSNPSGKWKAEMQKVLTLYKPKKRKGYKNI